LSSLPWSSRICGRPFEHYPIGSGRQSCCATWTTSAFPKSARCSMSPKERSRLRCPTHGPRWPAPFRSPPRRRTQMDDLDARLRDAVADLHARADAVADSETALGDARSAAVGQRAAGGRLVARAGVAAAVAAVVAGMFLMV